MQNIDIQRENLVKKIFYLCMDVRNCYWIKYLLFDCGCKEKKMNNQLKKKWQSNSPRIHK